MTLDEAMQAVIDGKHRFRGYPAYYTIRVTAGWGLFAKEGEHRGASLGTLWDGGLLHLYGRANFAGHGGLAWGKGYGYYMTWSGGRWRGDPAWNAIENIGSGKIRRAKP